MVCTKAGHELTCEEENALEELQSRDASGREPVEGDAAPCTSRRPSFEDENAIDSVSVFVGI